MFIMNDKILEEIKENSLSKDSQESSLQENQANKVNYLIFLMNDEPYAIESNLSREILNDFKVYKLPFVPNYIKGVLNRLGDAYTVLDPMILFSKSEQTSNLFLVCKLPQEKFCFKITDVLEFFEVDETEINSLEKINGIDYFSSSFLWNGKEVPILNISSFLQKIRRDLKNE